MKFETSGCGKKLSYSKLSNLPSISTQQFFGLDAGHIYDGGNLIFTIDTARMIGDSSELFGQLAVTHALGDIHSSRANGLSCAVSVGLIDEEGFDLESLMAGIDTACSIEGMSIAKGHTTYGKQEATITCAIVGRVHSSQSAPVGPFSVFLTKPLGAARLLKIATVMGNKDEINHARGVMLHSHKELVQKLSIMPCLLSDVSGFGLAGCLHIMGKKHGLDISLMLPIPRVDDIYGEINITCEYQRNYQDFLQYLDVSDGVSKLDLFGQEFCGPNIIILNEADSEKLISIGRQEGFDLIEIGSAVTSKGQKQNVKIERR